MEIGAYALLILAVFGASLLQAATGIGYGVIAGPIFLVVLNGSEAFQISTVHNFLIALMLAPFVFRGVDRTALKFLLVGSAFGIPAGFVVQAHANVIFLKIVSAIAVSFVAAALIADMVKARRIGTDANAGAHETMAIGFAAGTMGGMLAMPGPLASTWMSIRGWRKTEIRATILTFFLFSYGSGIVLHGLFSEVSTDTVKLSLFLAPVVFVGIVIGHRATSLISEIAFRNVLLVVLVATVVSLFASVTYP